MDSSSLSSITYEVWGGYSTRETVDTERALLSAHLFVVSTHIETLTLRLSSVAFTLIMTSPCFIKPTVVVLLEKEGVTKPDVPSDWYAWRGNGK